MKTVNKKLLAVAVAGALGMGSAVPAMAGDGLSANVAMTSNYIWRGVVQGSKENLVAIQGGFDYTKGALSVGTWGSSLGTGGTEIDLYGSYSFGPVTVGLISYQYPAVSSSFSEANVGGDVGPVSLMASYQLDGTNPYYVEASYSTPIGKASLDLHVGYGGSYVTTSGSNALDYSIGVSGSAYGLDLAAVYSSSDADQTLSGPGAGTSAGQFAVSASKSF